MALSLSRRSALALLGTTLAGPAWGVEPSRVVYVLPLLPAPNAAELDLAVRALEGFYAVSVRRLPAEPLPRSAFYAPRHRHRADKLLEHLASKAPADALRIVGLTAGDISTTKGPHADWGVLGLADLSGPACVLSCFRCRLRAKNPEHARVRFAKTAVHELGHTFRLEHCPAQGCLMQDGAGTVLTTDQERDLCADCRKRLEQQGLLRNPVPAPPW